MEDFTTSMKLYTKLAHSKGIINHEADDIAANLSAARAQNAWTTGTGGREDKGPQDSYEVIFNFAYELIGLGKLAQAEEALNHAESMGMFIHC